MVSYAPSAAPLQAADGGQFVGQFATLAVGSTAFQVFTIDYVEAEARRATAQVPPLPDSLARAIHCIWPQRPGAGDVSWPLPAFPNDSFDRLVHWDMALRRGAD